MKILKLLFFTLCPILILSCKKDEYPILNNEDPVRITAAAQTTLVYGKNISNIIAHNPQIDIVEDTYTIENGNNRTIKAEWITISCGDKYPPNAIEIVVQENTSAEDRYYYLTLTHRDNVSIVKIVQFGQPQLFLDL